MASTCCRKIPTIELVHTRGDTFSQFFTFKRPVGKNWTGVQVFSQLRKYLESDDPVAQWAPINLSQIPENFDFLLTLQGELTQKWQVGKYIGDIQFLFPTGRIWTPLKYVVSVIGDTTRGAVVPTTPIAPPPVETFDYQILTQNAHGFTPGMGIALRQGTYLRSSLANLDNLLCVAVPDPNTFVLAGAYRIFKVPRHGYPTNVMLYVSSTPGVLTDQPPAPDQNPLVRLPIGHCPTPDHFFYQPNKEPT